MAYQRTFRVQGGEVTFLVRAGEVRAIRSDARPGYNVFETRFTPQSLRVSFVSAGHTSRVYAEWRAGPYAEITESVT
jgi:hypothetical protein